MILNPKKVMVIYNTDDSSNESEDVADYYIAARNLDPAYKHGFALGTLDSVSYATISGTWRTGVLTDINTAINTTHGDVEGVVVSINCPQNLELSNVAGDDTDHASFCKVVGSIANVIAADKNMPLCSIERTYRLIDTAENMTNSGSGPTWYRVLGPAKDGTGDTDRTPVYDWRNADARYGYSTIPCGRIGYHTNASTMNDDADIAYRCIDDAIAFEQSGVVYNQPVLFGFSDRSAGAAPHLRQGNVYDAYRVLAPRVKTVHTYDGNYTDAPNNVYAIRAWTWAQPTITIPDAETFLKGTSGADPIDVWGWVGTGNENHWDYYQSVTFADGSWMYEGTSSGLSEAFLPYNGCSTIVTIGPSVEPTTSGIPEIGCLVTLLMRGYSMMEAEICSLNVLTSNTYSKYTEARGDPLYSPLQSLGIDRKVAGISAADPTI